MSDTNDVADDSRNGMTQIAKRLTEARIEERDRELIARVVTELLASGEERTRLLGQIDQLRAELAEARSSILQLEKERAEAASERDVYLRAVYGLLPKPESPFTEEELSSLIHSGLSFDDIIKDLEKLKGSSQTVEEQKQLIERLQKENANLTAERDQYLRSLYFYVRKEMSVSEEEIAFLEQLDPTKENGVSFEV